MVNPYQPYSYDLQANLFICNFEIINLKEIIVSFLVDSTAFDFGISFRVRQWVNASIKVLVIPTGYRLNDSENMLISKDVQATFVLDPRVYDRPAHALLDLNVPRIAGDGCDEYLIDVDCDTEAEYSIYAGSSPGPINTDRDHLIDIPSQTLVAIRNSIVTMSAKRSCSFCVKYSILVDGTIFEHLDQKILMNSYGYPWLFEKPPRDECFELSARFTSDYRHQIEARIERLEGGVLQVIGYSSSVDGDTCLTNSSRFNQSFSSPPAGRLEFQAFCLYVEWCPDFSLEGQHGFVMTVSPSNKPINMDELGCIGVIDLTNDQPTFIVHGLNLFYAGGMYRPLCLLPRCADLACPLVVDISSHCSADNASQFACSSVSPFEINGDYPFMDNCSFYQDQSTMDGRQKCQLRITSFPLYLRSIISIDSLVMLSSISIRLQDSMDDSNDFHLESINAQTQDLAFRFDQSETPSWISFAFIQGQQSLQKLRWDRPSTNCSYHLISGPPSFNQPGDSQHLITFWDTDQFITQNLESTLYSVRIPPNCAPSIYIKYQNSGADLRLEQELCRGRVLVESRGFQNPFEIPRDLQEGDDQGYYLWRRISCDSFLISNLTIELLSITNGQLSLQFFDEVDQYKSIIVQAGAKTPNTYRATNVKGVIVFWSKTQPFYEREGFLLHIVAEHGRKPDKYSGSQLTIGSRPGAYLHGGPMPDLDPKRIQSALGLDPICRSARILSAPRMDPRMDTRMDV